MKKSIFVIIVAVMMLMVGSAAYANTAFVGEKGRVYVWYEESDIHCVFEPKYQIFSDKPWIICDVFVVEADLTIVDFCYRIGEEPENEKAILRDIELCEEEES